MESFASQCGINEPFVIRSAHLQDVLEADLVIGGVLIPGAAAPKLVTKEQSNHVPHVQKEEYDEMWLGI